MSSVVGHDQIPDQLSKPTVCGIDQQKYSLLRKLLRITVYCLKFIKQRVWMTLSPVQKKGFVRIMYWYIKYLVSCRLIHLYVRWILNWLLICGYIVFNNIGLRMSLLLFRGERIIV